MNFLHYTYSIRHTNMILSLHAACPRTLQLQLKWRLFHSRICSLSSTCLQSTLLQTIFIRCRLSLRRSKQLHQLSLWWRWQVEDDMVKKRTKRYEHYSSNRRWMDPSSFGCIISCKWALATKLLINSEPRPGLPQSDMTTPNLVSFSF